MDDFAKNFEILRKEAGQNIANNTERYERIISGKESPENEEELFEAYRFLASEYADEDPRRAIPLAEEALKIGSRIGILSQYNRRQFTDWISDLKSKAANVKGKRPWWKLW